jgi:hypothetical protein
MNKFNELLKDADQDWQYGMLEDAYAKYCHLRDRSWHAAFQAAWIASAFDWVDLQPVIAVQPSELEHGASVLMEILMRRAAPTSESPRLPGGPAQWDIRTLRRDGHSGDLDWWTNKAKEAEECGLLGVAMSCWREAEELDPNEFYDPPSTMQLLPLKIDTHLQALSSADGDGYLVR